jgi:hypothetical protein
MLLDDKTACSTKGHKDLIGQTKDMETITNVLADAVEGLGFPSWPEKPFHTVLF